MFWMQTKAKNKYLVSSHYLLQHVFITYFIHMVQLLDLKTKQHTSHLHISICIHFLLHIKTIYSDSRFLLLKTEQRRHLVPQPFPHLWSLRFPPHPIEEFHIKESCFYRILTKYWFNTSFYLILSPTIC